jgi:hypothetical protein
MFIASIHKKAIVPQRISDSIMQEEKMFLFKDESWHKEELSILEAQLRAHYDWQAIRKTDKYAFYSLKRQSIDEQ